ncbi:phospholipase D alpha 1-like [Panicum miliaceum]|uniref:Phospholipase D alpha 1-like n=1 Tax=Panicum miliaceum TaxID=4540 RepID=A0A3L6QAW2_PANMI|nr:phospholipase D alpha 1-like [Panicum miliaceum]
MGVRSRLYVHVGTAPRRTPRASASGSSSSTSSATRAGAPASGSLERAPVRRVRPGRAYRPAWLWEDLYAAIRDARRFVYVAGWSVNAVVHDPRRMVPGAEGVTLGDLLKRKADEGVAVLVMPWQDNTSVSFLGNAGLMRTHDEETRRFFEGTAVRCFPCPRGADASLTVVHAAGGDQRRVHAPPEDRHARRCHAGR